MGTVYKRGESKFWFASYHNHAKGKTVRVSTKCTDRTAAIARLRELERRSASPDRSEDSAPLAEYASLYLDGKRRAGKADGTLSMMTQKARHLLRFFGEKTMVRAIKAKRVDEYIAQRQDEGAVNTTIYKEIVVLRGIIELAHRHDKSGPWSNVKPVDFRAEYKPRTRHLKSMQELLELGGYMAPHRRQHVMFMVATSANWGESLRARAEDIDLDRGLVRIRGTKNKYRERWVPIVNFARPMLEGIKGDRKSGPLFEKWGNVRRDLMVACAKAGLEPLSTNDLRRTFSKWLRAQGVEPHLIGAAMGHRDSRMVELVYGKTDPTMLQNLLIQRGVGCVDSERDSRDSAGHSGTHGTVASLDFPLFSVPRDRIELSTRGFSSPVEQTGSGGNSAADDGVDALTVSKVDGR